MSWEGVLVDRSSRSYRIDIATRDRNPNRLLAHLFAMAFEISRRGGCRASYRSAPDRARILRLSCAGSRKLPIGRWYESLTGHTLAFTFEGLVIGSLLYSLPFAVQPFAASFGAVDSKLLRASASLGESPLQTFRRVVLPLSKAGLVTGFALSFAHTLGEFGVVLMIGGNIPGVTRTVSIDIYDQVQVANYSSANRTALVLLLISFFALSIVYGLNRRAWAVGPWR